MDRARLEEKKTIREWEKEFGHRIMDPDGFDRSNPNLYNELFTREEFLNGLQGSTIMVENISLIVPQKEAKHEQG